MSTPAVIPSRPRRGRPKHGPDPWAPGASPKRGSITVHTSVPIGEGPFGFARALTEAPSGGDGWDDHGAMVAGT